MKFCVPFSPFPTKLNKYKEFNFHVSFSYHFMYLHKTKNQHGEIQRSWIYILITLHCPSSNHQSNVKSIKRKKNTLGNQSFKWKIHAGKTVGTNLVKQFTTLEFHIKIQLWNAILRSSLQKLNSQTYWCTLCIDQIFLKHSIPEYTFQAYLSIEMHYTFGIYQKLN